jgi:cystathionine beta-lyase family protein involved in aluminum resistance
MEEVFVEDLHRDLEKALEMIDEIAEKVQRKELDAFEGFMQSEEYKNKVVEIGYKLKELGIDITEMK